MGCGLYSFVALWGQSGCIAFQTAQVPGDLSPHGSLGLSLMDQPWAVLLAVSMFCSSGQAASSLQELCSRAVRERVRHLPAIYQPFQVSAGTRPLGGQPRGLCLLEPGRSEQKALRPLCPRTGLCFQLLEHFPFLLTGSTSTLCAWPITS